MIIIFLFCLHYKWFVLDNNHYFVCVVQINPMLWGQNVPTKKAVSEILDLVGYFFFYDKKKHKDLAEVESNELHLLALL